jgi:hypothetical protein
MAGKLCKLPAGGGWAIEGEIFEVQIGEKWWRAWMKSDGTAEGVRVVAGHSALMLFRGWPVPVALREGMRAGFFDGRERYAKPLSE